VEEFEEVTQDVSEDRHDSGEDGKDYSDTPDEEDPFLCDRR
jgi:hypothetical protein